MRKSIVRALETVKPFVPRVQFLCLVDGLRIHPPEMAGVD